MGRCTLQNLLAQNEWPPHQISQLATQTSRAHWFFSTHMLASSVRAILPAHNGRTVSRSACPRIIDRSVISESSLHTAVVGVTHITLGLGPQGYVCGTETARRAHCDCVFFENSFTVRGKLKFSALCFKKIWCWRAPTQQEPSPLGWFVASTGARRLEEIYRETQLWRAKTWGTHTNRTRNWSSPLLNGSPHAAGHQPISQFSALKAGPPVHFCAGRLVAGLQGAPPAFISPGFVWIRARKPPQSEPKGQWLEIRTLRLASNKYPPALSYDSIFFLKMFKINSQAASNSKWYTADFIFPIYSSKYDRY
jgi:hypothetical protein